MWASSWLRNTVYVSWWSPAKKRTVENYQNAVIRAAREPRNDSRFKGMTGNTRENCEGLEVDEKKKTHTVHNTYQNDGNTRCIHT